MQQHSTGVVFRQRVNDGKVGFARSLRREMTPAERLMWEQLRDRRLMGLKFRRQQLIDGFIVDFYCDSAHLVVEIDGGHHSKPQQHEDDERRARVFARRGLHEVRFANAQVMEDISGVLAEIRRAAEARGTSPGIRAVVSPSPVGEGTRESREPFSRGGDPMCQWHMLGGAGEAQEHWEVRSHVSGTKARSRVPSSPGGEGMRKSADVFGSEVTRTMPEQSTGIPVCSSTTQA